MKNSENYPPLVSVVMATYNRSPALAQTISNIFEQNYPNFELIVINDGSPDGTSTTLKFLQQRFSFSVIENVQNLGLQKSLNRGLSAAKGKYIARIDDHDLWIDPQKLQKQVDFLEANPDFGLVGTAYRINQQIFINPLTDKAIRQQILLRCPFCHVSVLIRQSILDLAGNYDEDLGYSEDWDLWLKMGIETKFTNLVDVTTEVVEPALNDSLSGSYFLQQLPLNRELVKQYLPFYPNPFKAKIYHDFLYFFFKFVPVDSVLHRWMQRVFKMSFLEKT